MPYIWMSHFSRMNESCHTYDSLKSFKRSSWTIANHVAHMNKSCHTYAWAMSHMNVSCRTLVMSHIWMSHATHMDELRHTNKWVMSHEWMSHVTRMNESCHSKEWVMSHEWMSRATRKHEHITRRNDTCNKRVWARMCHVTHKHCNTQPPQPQESRHTNQWVMSHEWMGLVMNESWHEGVMSHTGTATWNRPTRMSLGTKMYESCHTNERVMSHEWTSHVTRMNESCDEWVLSLMSHVTHRYGNTNPP